MARMNELNAVLSGRSQSGELSTTDTKSPTPAVSRPKSGLAEFGTTLRKSLQSRRRVRRTIKVLSGLNDDDLKDIGIERSEIERVVKARAGAAGQSLFTRLLDAYRTGHKRRVMIHELGALPDRILEDIGIPRYDIVATVDRLLAGRAGELEVVTPKSGSPVHDLRHKIETAARSLRQWNTARVAAGQMARLDAETLADLGSVKGDVDRVPNVMAKRRFQSPANRNGRELGAA